MLSCTATETCEVEPGLYGSLRASVQTSMRSLSKAWCLLMIGKQWIERAINGAFLVSIRAGTVRELLGGLREAEAPVDYRGDIELNAQWRLHVSKYSTRVGGTTIQNDVLELWKGNAKALIRTLERTIGRVFEEAEGLQGLQRAELLQSVPGHMDRRERCQRVCVEERW